VAQIGQKKNPLSTGALLVAVHIGTDCRSVLDGLFLGGSLILVVGSGRGKCDACGCHDKRHLK
jgi:hypothetical protein